MIKRFVALLGLMFLGACVGPNDYPTQAQSQLGSDFMKMGGAMMGCSQYGGLAGMGTLGSGKCEPPPSPPVTVYTKAQPKNCRPNPYRPNELECDNGLICKPNPYRPSELECN